MRDPKRIDRILSKVKELWERYPDLRLAQLVVNAVGETAPNIFYREDTELEKGLDNLLATKGHPIIKEETMDPETLKKLENGMKMMKSFVCEHKPSCDEDDKRRGGCCNSCWSRRWAEGMEKHLLALKS